MSGSPWECQLCLTENDHVDTNTNEPRVECEACEEERPGYKKVKKLINENSTNKIDSTASAILFGVKPAGETTASPLFGAAKPAGETTASPLFGAAKPAGETTASSGINSLFGAAKPTGETTASSGINSLFGAAKPTGETTASSGINSLFGAAKPIGETTAPTFGAETPATPIKSDTFSKSFTPLKSTVDETYGTSKLSSRIEPHVSKDIEFPEDETIASGKILVWGSGECDQLPFSEDDLGDDGIIKATGIEKLNKYCLRDVKCGALHTVVLIDDGRVATFGCNDEGALGRVVKKASMERYPGVVKFEDGTFVEQVEAIAAGNSHSMVMQKDGTVLVMGQYKASSGSKALMNGSKHPTKVALPHPAFAISSGNEHSIALSKVDGEVQLYGWGVNEFGVLGRTMTDNPSSEDLEESMRPTQITMPEEHSLLDAWAGGNVTVIKTEQSGSKDVVYFACGCNGSGEVGVGSDEIVIDKWMELKTFRNMSINTFALAECAGKAIDQHGNLYSWGHPDYLGDENKTNSREPVRAPRKMTGVPKLRQLFCGGRTNFGVCKYNARRVVGWGDSMLGQLMQEADAPVALPEGITELENKIIVAIASGSQHCTAIIAEPSVVNAIPEPSKKRQRSVSEDEDLDRKHHLPNEPVAIKRAYPARERKVMKKF